MNREDYGCNCENKTFTFVKEISNNKIYMCDICGKEDHLLSYIGSGCGVNERMKQWYAKESFDKAFNRKPKIKFSDYIKELK